MFKIEERNIYLTRGDSATIELSIENYTFEVGDKIEFRVYNRKRLNEKPLLSKTVEIKESCDSIDIELTSEETRIGEMRSTTMEYWYEIELNDKQTVVGYEEGPAVLYLYPEGAE